MFSPQAGRRLKSQSIFNGTAIALRHDYATIPLLAPTG